MQKHPWLLTFPVELCALVQFYCLSWQFLSSLNLLVRKVIIMLINDLFTMNQPVELPKYECNVSISTLLTLSHTMSVSHPCTNLMEAQKKVQKKIKTRKLVTLSSSPIRSWAGTFIKSGNENTLCKVSYSSLLNKDWLNCQHFDMGQMATPMQPATKIALSCFKTEYAGSLQQAYSFSSLEGWNLLVIDHVIKQWTKEAREHHATKLLLQESI